MAPQKIFNHYTRYYREVSLVAKPISLSDFRLRVLATYFDIDDVDFPYGGIGKTIGETGYRSGFIDRKTRHIDSNFTKNNLDSFADDWVDSEVT